MELEILLARAQAAAWTEAGHYPQAEQHLRRALELGSQRGEEQSLVELRLRADDHDGVTRLLQEFADRLNPERARLYRTISQALQGQPPAEGEQCWQELAEQDLFSRALLAHALQKPDADEHLERALEVQSSAWNRRKLEELQLRRQGEASCSLCQQHPAVRLWCGEKPLCSECSQRVEDPEALMRLFQGQQDPESLQLAAWIGHTQSPAPHDQGLTLELLSPEQLLKELPPDFELPEGSEWGLQTAVWYCQLEGRPLTALVLRGILSFRKPKPGPALSRACERVFRAGHNLHPQSLEFLAGQLQQRPDDLFLHCLLLGGCPVGDARKQELGLWFVRNFPELSASREACRDASLRPEFQARAVQAWSEQVLQNPGYTAVLGNAASFFTPDRLELAEALASHCINLEPGNAEWYRKLAHILQLSSRDQDILAKALVLMERSLELEKPEARESLLTDMLRLAVDAQEDQKAALWGQELIDKAQPGWNQGNALHQAHLALGRLALKQDQLAEAETRLLKAAQVPTSPQLGSFGPNMLLAQELLERGSTQPVLDYLEECKTFWASGTAELEEWIEEIKDGRKPEFGANLSY
ncbi:hypothetical protein ABS71_19395 [bacterium SCN 62-11]|nr:hypothetical protein [Candidatus Eremiobacteraeota bacterium]ODT57718.1 MAG: hypothetical protein ABS71_19395 [bacterium SCN 62-11]